MDVSAIFKPFFLFCNKVQSYIIPPKLGLNRISYPTSICVKVRVIFSNCAAVKDLWSHLIGNDLIKNGQLNLIKKHKTADSAWVYLAILTNWMNVISKNAIPKPILQWILLCVWLRHQEYCAFEIVHLLICDSVPMLCTSSIKQWCNSVGIFTMAVSSIFIEHIRLSLAFYSNNEMIMARYLCGVHQQR